jgi:hypothetical protein
MAAVKIRSLVASGTELIPDNAWGLRFLTRDMQNSVDVIWLIFLH